MITATKMIRVHKFAPRLKIILKPGPVSQSDTPSQWGTKESQTELSDTGRSQS